jgi:hypothetical protein
MGSDIGCTSHEVLVGGVQMSDVPALHDQDDDPIDAGGGEIEGERRPHLSVLSPYRMAVVAMVAVWRSIECVVQSRNNHKQPGYDCQGFVGEQGTLVKLERFVNGLSVALCCQCQNCKRCS